VISIQFRSLIVTPHRDNEALVDLKQIEYKHIIICLITNSQLSIRFISIFFQFFLSPFFTMKRGGCLKTESIAKITGVPQAGVIERDE
jgi:hypothetical protein